MTEFITNLFSVELAVTYRCNIKCNNCIALCTQAPFKGDLSPSNIEAFLKDSLDNKYPWTTISLHGGEPVLNPEIMEICQLLYDYRLHSNENVDLILFTNYSTQSIQDLDNIIKSRYDIRLGISHKPKGNFSSNNRDFPYTTVNESPSDLGVGHTLGCYVTQDCAVCYNHLGFFECSGAAAAARVFNFNPIALSTKGLTQDKCQEAFKIHCTHCGFSNLKPNKSVNQVTSDTWKRKLNDYASNKSFVSTVPI